MRSLPRRSRVKEALRNLGSAVRGPSETLRLGAAEKPLPSITEQPKRRIERFGKIHRFPIWSVLPHFRWLI